jgi:hypothetical protein
MDAGVPGVATRRDRAATLAGLPLVMGAVATGALTSLFAAGSPRGNHRWSALAAPPGTALPPTE